MKQPFSIKDRLNSFKYAFNGLKILIGEEHNSRIHLFSAICVILLGFVLQVSMYEWIVLFFAIGFVFAMETVNAAIENLADHVSPERHDMIKKVKDLSAAAVLISSITALIAGMLVFIPKLI